MEKAALVSAVVVGTAFGGRWLWSGLSRSLAAEIPRGERMAALASAMVPVAASGLMAAQAVWSR